MRRTVTLLAGLSLLLIALPSSAATFRASEEESFSIDIPVNGDLYVAGGAVQINKNIDGDLLIVGGDVAVKGDVKQDVQAAGGTIMIEGKVSDDIRAAGGDVTVKGIVNGDVIVTGGRVRIERSAVIAGDTVIMGGDAVMDGVVRGKLTVRSGRVIIGGSVGGDADVRADAIVLNGKITGSSVFVSETVRTGSDARIGGDLSYWLPRGEKDFSSVVKGEASFDPSLRKIPVRVDKATMIGAITLAVIAMAGLSLLSSAFFILLVTMVTKTFFRDTAKRARKTPWTCLWHGLVTVVIIPVVGILLLISVIGIPLGLLTFVAYGFMLFFLKPMTAIVAARWLEVHYQRNWGRWMAFIVSVGCFIIIKLLGLIPFLGWIAVSVAALIALGAITVTKWEKFKKVA
ncbi:MAG: hypothetical protein PHH13_00325 [Candidatus Peribacteraceae bacterium]|nr:hypothetical protein [Candidatus Peribacteraceae bacterium]